jgi:hypothetical protein
VLDANLNNTLKCKHRMGEKNREREFVCVSSLLQCGAKLRR